jgi:hypothetical protein
MKNEIGLIPSERIIHRIFVLRGEKVMLDVHLAELYNVETRVLKQAVKRNLNRFPDDFMFEIDKKEIELVVSQSVIPSKQSLGGAVPFAFMEGGIAMLSSVLKSKQAIDMNISIIRTFILLRKISSNYQKIAERLQLIEKKYEGRFKEIYKALDYLMNPTVKDATAIGFKRKDEK